jgi:hypothetical protein
MIYFFLERAAVHLHRARQGWAYIPQLEDLLQPEVSRQRCVLGKSVSIYRAKLSISRTCTALPARLIPSLTIGCSMIV